MHGMYIKWLFRTVETCSVLYYYGLFDCLCYIKSVSLPSGCIIVLKSQESRWFVDSFPGYPGFQNNSKDLLFAGYSWLSFTTTHISWILHDCFCANTLKVAPRSWRQPCWPFNAVATAMDYFSHKLSSDGRFYGCSRHVLKIYFEVSNHCTASIFKANDTCYIGRLEIILIV